MTHDRLKLYLYKEHEDFELPPEHRDPGLIDLLQAPDAPHEDVAGEIDLVEEPGRADLIVFPYRLDNMFAKYRSMGIHFFINGLPYYREYENRHVFHASHDRGQPLLTRAIVLTHAPRRSNKDDSSLCTLPHQPMPHVSEAAPGFAFDKIKYDVCFTGTLSDPLRLSLVKSIEGKNDLKYFLRYPNTLNWSDKETSYLHMDDKTKKKELEALYVNTMRKSWTVLCPRGMGSFSVRFYETLCMGRIPVHVSDEYIFPFQDRIDYSEFCINIPQSAAGIVGDVLEKWFRKKSREDLEAICRKARAVWEEHFFLPENAPRIMLESLRMHVPGVRPVDHSKYVQVPRAVGEGTRDGHVEGFFANLDIDNRDVWINKGLSMKKSGLDESGQLNECNGVPCYLPVQDINFLFEMALRAPTNGNILEIGSWMGASAIAMANALFARRNLGARIYCVDTWLGSEEHQHFDFIQRDEMFNTFLHHLRDNLAHFLVEPIRAPSLEAAGRVNDESLDLLFVDGDHSYEGCFGDLEAWYPKVKKNGIIIGHDYYADTKNPVYRAAHDFCGPRGLPVHEPENLRFFLLNKAEAKA